MINEHCVKDYCSEDISLIENYDLAIADTTKTWCCHHRAEILPCGVFKPEDLKKFGLYFNRPASELIFMTKADHNVLHNKNPTKETRDKRGRGISIAKIGVPQFHRRRKILQYTTAGDFLREWQSITEIKRTLNISHSSIIAVCNGKYHQAGGYIWKYA